MTETLLGLLLFAGFLLAGAVVDRVRRRARRPRHVRTRLGGEEIAAAFERTVGAPGWTVFARGNPLVAESLLVTGIRERVAVRWVDHDDHREVWLWSPRPTRTLLRPPARAATTAARMAAFLVEVRRRDGSAVVTG